MGQYFQWVNFTKLQTIETWVWPNGQKLEECTYVGCEETDAALTMIAGEWKGDLVAFLGDYAHFENESIPARKEIEQIISGRSLDDFVIDVLEDITGRFDYTETAPYRTHPVWPDDPDQGSEEVEYDGSYDIKIEHFRYVINESKHEFVDRTKTPVRFINKYTGEIVRYDPVPSLMSSNMDGYRSSDKIAGLWIGDQLRPSHEPPERGYVEIGRDYSYWAPPIVNATDSEILSAINEGHLDIGSDSILDEIAAILSES